MGKVVPLNQQEHEDTGFDLRVKRALAEALDGMRDNILKEVRKNPRDGNAIKALSMLTASSPLVVHYIKNLSHNECVQIMNLVEAFRTKVVAIDG